MTGDTTSSRNSASTQARMTAGGANLLVAIVSPYLQPPQGSSSFLVQLFLMSMLGAVSLTFAALLLERVRSFRSPQGSIASLAEPEEAAPVRSSLQLSRGVAWLETCACYLLVLAFLSQFLLVQMGLTKGAGLLDSLPALFVAMLVLLSLWLAFRIVAHHSTPAARTAAAAATVSSTSSGSGTRAELPAHIV